MVSDMKSDRGARGGRDEDSMEQTELRHPKHSLGAVAATLLSLMTIQFKYTRNVEFNYFESNSSN